MYTAETNAPQAGYHMGECEQSTLPNVGQILHNDRYGY